MKSRKQGDNRRQNQGNQRNKNNRFQSKKPQRKNSDEEFYELDAKEQAHLVDLRLRYRDRAKDRLEGNEFLEDEFGFLENAPQPQIQDNHNINIDQLRNDLANIKKETKEAKDILQSKDQQQAKSLLAKNIESFLQNPQSNHKLRSNMYYEYRIKDYNDLPHQIQKREKQVETVIPSYQNKHIQKLQDFLDLVKQGKFKKIEEKTPVQIDEEDEYLINLAFFWMLQKILSKEISSPKIIWPKPWRQRNHKLMTGNRI